MQGEPRSDDVHPLGRVTTLASVAIIGGAVGVWTQLGPRVAVPFVVGVFFLGFIGWAIRTPGRLWTKVLGLAVGSITALAVTTWIVMPEPSQPIYVHQSSTSDAAQEVIGDAACREFSIADMKEFPSLPVTRPVGALDEWIVKEKAVPLGTDYLSFTLQAKLDEAVIIGTPEVSIDARSESRQRRSFTPELGCGGAIEARIYEVNLDEEVPILVGAEVPDRSNETLPSTFQIGKEDVEKFVIVASASTHDVKWHINVRWHSGDTQGVLRIDQNGKPFDILGDSKVSESYATLGESDWFVARR